MNDQDYIKYIQAHNNIPISGKMDQMTLSCIKSMMLSNPNFKDLRRELMGGNKLDTLGLRKIYDHIIQVGDKAKLDKKVKTKEEQDKFTSSYDGRDLCTDASLSPYVSIDSGIRDHFLDNDQYIQEPSNKEYIFIHHTAGWDSPKNQIDIWNNDLLGRIATAYVIGGRSIKQGYTAGYTGNDGSVMRAFPEQFWAYHLGGTGRGIDQHMEKSSIGIELCNFGWIKDGKTWAGQTVSENEIIELDKEFRGYKQWHKYSDKQLSSCKSLIISLANRYSIDVRNKGLIKWIKQGSIDSAFAFKPEAAAGNYKGLLSHTNVRKDKFDVSPQPKLIDMLLSI